MNITLSLNGFYIRAFSHTIALPKNIWEESKVKKIKRSVALIMCAMMMTGLFAACGSADESPASSENTTTPKGNVSGEAKEDTKSDGKKTVVTVWTKDRHDAEYQQAKVDEYNATNEDNIEVRYEIYSDNYPQAIDIAFQSNEAPDIMVHQSTVFNNYVNTGNFADLAPFMDDDFLAVFGDTLVEGVNVIDGKCYFVPTTATTCRLFYNKNIFEKAGIANPPESLEEMVEDAKLITSKLSSEGIYGFAANLKSASSALSRSLMPMAERSIGNHLGFDFAKGEYDFTGYAPLLKAWKTLCSEECAFPGCESLDIDPLRTQFADGKIGMYMSYTHAEPGVYENQFPMTDEWGCAEIPVLGGTVKGAENYTPNNGYLFNAASENLEAAWKAYVAIFANVDNLAGYYSAGLGISSVDAVIAKSTPKAVYSENPKLLLGSTDKLWPKAPHERNVDAVVVEGKDFYTTFNELIYLDADIDSELAALTDRYNEAYRKGISEGTGVEVKIDGFDPMNP